MYDKASIALIPSGYKDGDLYSVLPANGDGDFNFTRSSTATRVNKDGLIETIPLHTPRLDYPLTNGVVGDCPHLLLEPQKTNVIINSNSFNGNANVVVETDNTISPDGNLNGSKITANSGTSLKLVDTNGAASNTYIFSVFAKKGTHNIIQLGGGGVLGHANFNLETGEHSSLGSMLYYANGWYRCSVQFSAGTPTSHYVSFSDDINANRLSTSNSDGNIFLYGMQSETNYMTSYIPTTTIAETRSADFCNDSGTSAEFNDSEGVLFAEIEALANDGTKRRITINNGASTQFVQLEYRPTTNTIQVGVYNGSSQGFFTETLSDITEFNKIAYSYKENEFKLFANGSQLSTTITSGTTFSSGTLNTLSFDNGASADVFYGKCKQLIYFNEALSDSELQTLTS